MRRFTLIGALAFSLIGCHSGGMGSGGAEPKTEEQKTLYAIGLYLAKQVGPFSLKPDELTYVVQGLRDGTSGAKPVVELQAYGPKLNEMARARTKAKSEAEKAAAVSVLAAAAAESGAEKLPSGLVYKSITEGSGESPKATDRVKVKYTGTLRDGTVFDSTAKHPNGDPAVFGLTGVIPCWTEGMQKMKVGGKAKLTCPSEIAYGERGRPPTIPGGAVLTFEVELMSIEPPAAAPMNPMHIQGPGGNMVADPHNGALNRPLQMSRPGSAPPASSTMPAPKKAPASSN